MSTNVRKHIVRIALLVTVLFAAMPLAASIADEDQQGSLGMARVTYLTNDALFISPDIDEWSALSPNFTLQEGDRLWAGEDSNIEVTFADGHVAWVNDNSELDMVHLSRDPDGNVYQLALTAGEASFSVRKIQNENSVFQLDTQNASIRVSRRAAFRVTALSDGTTQVGVSRGQVEVETDDGITTIKRGEMAEIDQDGYVDISPLPGDDSWDRWVASRASRYDRPAESSRYLPKDMSSYGYEFDEGGRWTSTPDYGNVWVPTSVALDWSPYSNGRWVWVGGDYVWLSYDPWYAPFHYGRWSWSVGIGWCWVPPLTPVAYWSPGYVGWVWGADSVCWVPLAPREVYYGYGYYGPHSVNIRRTKVFNVTNVYINSRANNGVVIVHRDNFMRGDTSRVRIRDKSENPFTGRNRGNFKIIGRPPVEELRPTRETRLPKPDFRLDRRDLPPQKFEKPASFIKERKAAKTAGESVFRPGRAPMDLKKFDRVNVPKEQRRPKEQRIREEKPRIEKGPAKEIQPGATDRKQMPGRDRQMERDRTLAPETAPAIEKDNRRPRVQEETAPSSGAIKKTPEQDRGVVREPQFVPDEDRRGLQRDRIIQKDTGQDVVPSSRATIPPARRLEGGQPDKTIDRGVSEQVTREPGFRRDKPRATEQNKEGKQKQKKVKDQKNPKEKEDKKGDKDKEEAPR